ncbi:nucleoside hydrolase [Bacillus sp. SA1-12]|uniref:nucleoside hydrolase n=1 Tax=Bacillus sp. SA1-12 TaxID=1455638 RepID=UPI000A5930B2|nr:nucleoside hydrolase [Bacillus sp. SA1-12]
MLFFGDFGIDDIIALLYAFYSKEIDLAGVVVDYGNIPKENATRTATYLHEITGRTNVPIIGGAVRPLTGEYPIFYPEIHGEYGMGPIIPKLKKEPPSEFENFHEITTIINEYESDLVIVNVGRLTSLATAIVLYPNLLKRVKEFYVMGGAFLYPGNASPVAEANFYSDQYAANLVLTYMENVKLFPLNITNYAIIPEIVMKELHSYSMAKQDQIGQMLKPMIDFYSDWYKKRDPTISGGPMHDLLTLWAVANNEYFQYLRKPVKIDTSNGEARGLSIGDFRPYSKLADYPIHNIAIRFDYHQFISDVVKTFKKGLT